jgi:hypothetical protein
MDTYFEYVHNLKGGYRFERFRPAARNAIVSHFIRELDDLNALEQAITRETDKDVLNYIRRHLNLKANYKGIILTTRKSSFVDEVDFNTVQAIINLQKINNIQHPNKLLRAVNTLLPKNGLYIGCMQTNGERKKYIFRKAGKYLGQVLWYLDFLVNRVLPRIPLVDDLYYRLTNGQFHAITQAEVMGRLVYCGFQNIDFRSINGFSYFVAVKAGRPYKYEHPSYYPIIRLRRVGKNGKMIGVYKFRTMHPYSEYLQDIVVKKNGYDGNGKPASDFRITQWGKLVRRFWIDELPQIVNVIKGEMKLVGLRPLSQVRFNELPADLRKERIKYKPGCFPPYVALNMPDEKNNIMAEWIYINDLRKHPYTVDIRYLMKALLNIVSNKIQGS